MKRIDFFVIASGEIEIRRLRLKHYYKAQLTYGCENPFQMIEQYFEYIAIVDFEATCESNQGNNYPHEIIEFPIVLINVQQQTIVMHYLKKRT
jgi:3'-5' exoribonuclease 1